MIVHTFACFLFNPNVAIERSCCPVGSNASSSLACSVIYDFWLLLLKRSQSSIAICGSEGLCTIVRAVCNSIASPLPEQRVVEVETGLYEGAAGSTPVCDLVDWIFCVEVGRICSAALSQMEV